MDRLCAGFSNAQPHFEQTRYTLCLRGNSSKGLSAPDPRASWRCNAGHSSCSAVPATLATLHRTIHCLPACYAVLHQLWQTNLQSNTYHSAICAGMDRIGHHPYPRGYIRGSCQGSLLTWIVFRRVHFDFVGSALVSNGTLDSCLDLGLMDSHISRLCTSSSLPQAPN